MTHQTLVNQLHARCRASSGAHPGQTCREWQLPAKMGAEPILCLDCQAADALTGQEGAAPSPRAEGSTSYAAMDAADALLEALGRSDDPHHRKLLATMYLDAAWRRGSVESWGPPYMTHTGTGGEPPEGTEPAAQPPSGENR